MSLRELFWAGQEVYLTQYFLPIIIVVLILFPILILLFGFGFGRSYRLWRLGGAENRFDHWLIRLRSTLAVALVHFRILLDQDSGAMHHFIRKPFSVIRSLFREPYPGVMHFLIVGGSALLILGKIIRPFSYFVGLTNPPQSVFLYASLASEIGAALIFIGGCMAIYRRYVLKPARLDTTPDNTLIYVWVFLIILTGFLVKGYRIATSEVTPTDWAMWSPIGYLFSQVFPTFMTEAENQYLVLHRTLLHVIPAFIFLGYIWLSRSHMQHIVLAPLNVFFHSLKPKGSLTPIDLETAETFGVAKIKDFTWKQLLDLDACTRCGRCQDVCPAYLSGKTLSPKKLIQDLKTHLYQVYPIPLVTKPVESPQDMIAEVITEDAIWDCTTCRACQQACPIYVEHIDKIMDMRRNLAMERAQFPESAQDALKSLGDRGHPWRGTTATRTDWTSDLEIKVLSEDTNIDILYWVGCTAALDERNMKVAIATVKILQAAGINFGILGAEETCCGDPARRMGDEYLFQTLCQKNIELLQRYKVKKLLTTCPHCFNTLKNEYPQFGGNFEVIHHTQLIADLIGDGKLKLGRLDGKRVAYHDSCYLGRYNDIYQPPREILKAVSGIRGVELARFGARSFCCGGGGGHMWMEEDPDKRVNVRRVEDIIEAKVDLVATACPYCLIQLEDGLKAKGVEESIKDMDLSELVVEALR